MLNRGRLRSGNGAPPTFAGVKALLAYANFADTDGEGWPADLVSDDKGTERPLSAFLPDREPRGSPARHRGGGVMDQIDIESGINDVTNMAAISALLMAQLTDTLHEAARAGVSGRQAIETHQWLVDLVSFASLETKLKAEELSKQFYAKTEKV